MGLDAAVRYENGGEMDIWCKSGLYLRDAGDLALSKGSTGQKSRIYGGLGGSTLTQRDFNSVGI